MRGKWKRDLLIAFAIAVLFGQSVTWVLTLDQSGPWFDFCTPSIAGGGLVPLPDTRPQLYCDPQWGMIALSTGYFGLPALALLFALIQGGRWVIHRCRKTDHGWPRAPGS